MNGIQIKYSELFRVSVKQLFYRNTFYKQSSITPETDLLIMPTSDCTDIMKRLNLVSKNTDENGGLMVFASVAGINGGGNNILKFRPKKTEVLRFLILLQNKNVVNFNDLPVSRPDSLIYYFNNEVTDSSANRSGLHITKDAAGVNAANDSIKTSTENYRFHNASVVAPGSAKVRHIVTGQMAEPVSLNTQSGQSDLSFNLSIFSEGRCELLINNLPADEFYYLERYSMQPVFGIIEFSLSDTVASNYRIVEADNSLTIDRPFYLISFSNRETFWRYTIRLQSSSPISLEISALTTDAERTDFINKLNIVTNDSTVTFSRVSATDTEFVYVSDRKLFFQERYLSATSSTTQGSRVVFDPLNIILKKNINDANEVAVKSGLPYPSTGSINSSSLPKIYSDIFITI